MATDRILHWRVKDGEVWVCVHFWERTKTYACARCGYRTEGVLCWHMLAARLDGVQVVSCASEQDRLAVELQEEHAPTPLPTPTPTGCGCIHPVASVCASFRVGGAIGDRPCDCACHQREPHSR